MNQYNEGGPMDDMKDSQKKPGKPAQRKYTNSTRVFERLQIDSTAHCVLGLFWGTVPYEHGLPIATVVERAEKIVGRNHDDDYTRVFITLSQRHGGLKTQIRAYL